MFGKNFHDKVSKHLDVFHKAVDGLKQVQAEIKEEVARKIKFKQAAAAAIQDQEKQIAALNIHAEQVGDTISKITTLLPSKEASNG